MKKTTKKKIVYLTTGGLAFLLAVVFVGIGFLNRSSEKDVSAYTKAGTDVSSDITKAHVGGYMDYSCSGGCGGMCTAFNVTLYFKKGSELYAQFGASKTWTRESKTFNCNTPCAARSNGRDAGASRIKATIQGDGRVKVEINFSDLGVQNVVGTFGGINNPYVLRGSVNIDGKTGVASKTVKPGQQVTVNSSVWVKQTTTASEPTNIWVSTFLVRNYSVKSQAIVDGGQANNETNVNTWLKTAIGGTIVESYPHFTSLTNQYLTNTVYRYNGSKKTTIPASAKDGDIFCAVTSAKPYGRTKSADGKLHTDARYLRSNIACVKVTVPNSTFTTSVNINTNSDVVYAGETVEVGATASVKTSSALPSETQVTVSEFLLDESAELKDISSSTGNYQGNDKFISEQFSGHVVDSGFVNFEVDDIDIRTKKSYSLQDTNRYVPDSVNGKSTVGMKYCIVAGVNYANLATSTANQPRLLSNVECKTIAKKPSFYVSGGNIYAENDISASTSIKHDGVRLDTTAEGIDPADIEKDYQGNFYLVSKLNRNLVIGVNSPIAVGSYAKMTSRTDTSAQQRIFKDGPSNDSYSIEPASSKKSWDGNKLINCNKSGGPAIQFAFEGYGQNVNVDKKQLKLYNCVPNTTTKIAPSRAWHFINPSFANKTDTGYYNIQAYNYSAGQTKFNIAAGNKETDLVNNAIVIALKVDGKQYDRSLWAIVPVNKDITTYAEKKKHNYGSGTEYLAVSGGSINNFASGNTLHADDKELNLFDLCDLSPLTIANDRCKSDKSLGNASTSLRDGFVDTIEKMIKNGEAKNFFNVIEDGNITPAVAKELNNQNDKVNIVFADNINIDPAVEVINAWLIAKGAVDTCAGGDVPACNKQLTINGIVYANNIKLNRTYGNEYGSNGKPAERINLTAADYNKVYRLTKNYTDGYRPGKLETVFLEELAPRN